MNKSSFCINIYTNYVYMSLIIYFLQNFKKKQFNFFKYSNKYILLLLFIYLIIS